MKAKNLLITAIVAVSLASCTPKIYYYQSYKTTSEGLQQNEKAVAYEDQYCKVSYNLWGEGGNVGFNFYNKTDENIYLNLGECYFILNGNAYDYFKNRIFTSSVGTGASIAAGSTGTKSAGGSASVTGVNYWDMIQTNALYGSISQSIYSVGSVSASKGFSVAYAEERVVCIPSKTSKTFTEYKVTNSPYRDCNLLRFPDKRGGSNETFNKLNSPYVFSNRITYKMGQNENTQKIENEFYVSEIANYYEDDILKGSYTENCGQKNNIKTFYFKTEAPNNFYIKYTKPDFVLWKN